MTIRNITGADLVAAMQGDAGLLPGAILSLAYPNSPKTLTGVQTTTDYVLVVRSGVPYWAAASQLRGVSGTAPSLPGKPSVASTSVTTTVANLTITPPTSGPTPTSYLVAYQPAGGSLQLVNTCATTVALSSLLPAYAYTITVTAASSGVYGSASDPITVTMATPTFPILPHAGSVVAGAWKFYDLFGAGSTFPANSYIGGPSVFVNRYDDTAPESGGTPSIVGIDFGWTQSTTTRAIDPNQSLGGLTLSSRNTSSTPNTTVNAAGYSWARYAPNGPSVAGTWYQRFDLTDSNGGTTTVISAPYTIT